VRVDLKDNIPGTTDAIKSLINVDGAANILSFDVFINSGVDNQEVAGMYVWMDDVYIKKSNSTTGDNLITDGTIELGGLQGLGGTSNSTNYWFSNSVPVTFTCGGFSDNAERVINGTERKSGSYALSLVIPPMNQCSSALTYDAGIAVSIGTKIDFTDLLSCDDYSDQGFLPFPDGPYVEDVNPMPNTNYYIENDVVLNNSDYLKFAGCKVVIGPDVSIRVNSGCTLEIIDGTDASHLFACSGMWDGIVNQNGNVLIKPSAIAKPSKIEDAKLAIYSNGGLVKIRYAQFDHNYVGILLSNGNFDYTGSDGLFGINFKCTDGIISRAPYFGIPTTVHLQLENVTGVDIGSSGGTNGAYKNEFSDAGYAIISNNSSARIQNNYFNNFVENSTWCIDCGVGIKITNTNNAIRLVEIGGSTNPLDYEANTFTNVNKGVYAYNVCKDCSLSVSGNIFNNTNFKYSSSGNFYNTAISVQNPISFIRLTPLNVELIGNTIIDYRIGIHSLNMPSIQIGTNDAGTLISGNIIQFNKTVFPLNSFYEGIWLQNCAEAKVANNTISNAIEYDDLQFRGLDIESSANCFLNCNEIDKIGVAINIYDNCGTTKLRSNTMSHFFTGVWLNGPNGASIDVDQGDDNSQESWGNIWNWTAAPSLKVDGGGFGGVQTNWFHEGADVNSNPLSPRPWNANIVQPEPATSTSVSLCTSFFRTTPNRKDNFGPVVGDSALFAENEDASRYTAVRTSYIAMKNDSTLIYRSDSLDSDFESFFLRMDSSNVGKFQKVRELSVNWPDSAKVINASISDTNDIEYNLKTFNTLYFDKLIFGTAINSTDSTFLDGLLTGSAITEGESFYFAAAFFSREIHPTSYSSRLESLILNETIIQTPIQPNIFKIFPNPASNSINVEMVDVNDKIILIELYSSLGNLLTKKACNSKLFELNIQMYYEGLYTIRAFTKNGYSFTKTFSIIR
jgi:hypothetical protein